MTMTFPQAGLREGFTKDAGFLTVIPQTSPAAGANLPLDLGRAEWYVIRAVMATLTTDANVASRFLSVDYNLGTRSTTMRNAATVLVTASTTNQVFQFDNQHTVSEWNTGTMVFAPLAPIPLAPGWIAKLTVDSIQAGDQLSAVSVLVEQFERRDFES